MATLGRNIVFQIKNADGTPFHDLVLRKATVDSVVMSLGDKITGDVYYKDNTLQCTMQEYVEYKTNPDDPNENPIKYTIVNPPTIVREGLVKDNSDLKGMTKYSFEFYHPMYILGNLPFSDVAVSNDEKRYLSQNKTFSWIGKPQDYINKINKNLEGTEWIVVKSDRFPQEKEDELSDVLSFDNNTIADALKTGYETWGLPYVVSQINIGEPYYSQGKRFKVEFGLPSNEILVNNEQYTFQFGQGVGLKNNSRTPRNNKIITRIAGYGSENNIPYGYPQIRWYGDQSATQTPAGYPIYDGIVGGVVRKLIKHPFTRTHLMPSVYSQTVFNKVSPYLANGSANPDYNPDEEIVDYYDAVYSEEYQYINEINLLAPSYEIHGFDDIKPELDSDRQLGIVSAIPLNQDLTPASQWDDTYDAEKDEYVQSYFKITLPQLSFDLYACASIMEEMQVNMRSGVCLGCTFPIQVDWEDYKRNFYDADGNFLPDGSQRDLTKYPKSNLGQIDIIVQKETQTFGTLMPNIYQQPRANDLFVILGISMPVEYITNAEERLDDAMKSYMLENNVYYYDYPLKFDEYFLATHTNILAQIRPNSIIRFGFKGYPTPLELFVKQITVKYGDDVLPQYDITLTDNIEIVLNQIGQVADDVEKLGSLVAILRQTYNRNIWSELDKKLSKVKDDSTPHKLGMGEMQVDGDGTIGNDLSVGGDLDVTGDTELDGDVTIGNSASDTAFINAIAKIYQEIKSNNYNGDSPFDQGWMIKNADANHGNASYMVIDNLFVRMKAIFTELEIRKISYAGGNIVLSHAGSTLVKVVPLTTTMQPTVVDGKLTISGNLARVENNRLILDSGTVVGNRIILDGSQEVLYAYRCYIKKDDGTTATENWWRADDQARCQTFNIDETGTYHDVSNSFYWRRVMNVGSEVPIGETTDEVMDYVDLSALDCITGSTVPQAGDVIVQMGNRTDVSRQGFISLEVYGDDAPAFKVYKNVNGYTLEGKMPIIISPKNTSMKVQHYEIETDYGTFPAVKERGEWSLIPEHKCYYYDRVQHNGSSWLCVYPSGLTPEYTTDEPSLSSVYWKVDAKAGEPAPSYTEDWFTWSNVASVVNVTTEPTPNSGWLQTIGAQGSYTYLWRKLIRYIWNPTTRVYVADSTQYFRMSGTNGTSIDINGEVALHTDMEANGYVTPVGGTRHLAGDGESYVLQEDWTDSEGMNRQGHLFMWSTESTRWIPLGKFQGENGKTYYTHVAWATSVTYNQSTGEVTNVSGFVITKAPDDTTHFWMGVYVDENSAIDPSDALLYTWSYTKGEAGTSVFVDEENSSTEYAISTSGTQRPVSGWQSNPPSVPQGQFLWTRVTTVFTDGGQTVSYGVSYRGTDGDSVQIDTSRTYVRYSTVKTASQPADSTFTRTTPPELSEGDYLWSLSQTAYVGVTNVLKSYSVSRLGIDGDEGQRGPDGYTTHFAYATSPDGSQDFSTTNFKGAKYIGTYRDDQPDDSTTYTDYTWTLWGALELSQLVLSPSLIAIPTDTDGVVLEDFRQEIAVSMKTYSDVLSLKSVDFTANENVVVEASTLIAMSWSGASVNNGRLVNVEGSVNNGRLTISADDYAVVPTKIIVKATKGTTLTERTVSITATALDVDGNEYNGYNELTVQRQYRAEKPQFPSMVFKRSVTKPATPMGGTYDNPIPEGWEDGIPSGTGIVWASVCTFYGDGTSSGWSEPQAQIDTDNLDLEFSASSTEPSAPTGDVPFADHESEGWYDPTSPNLPEMVIWRAERKVKNGAYDGDWVVTRIYGEQGDTGANGYNTATIMLYKRSSTPITSVGITGDCTYNFETNALSGNLNNWSRTIPTDSTNEIYVTAATANSRETTDTIGVNEWATPAKMAANGAHGINTATVFLYARNATAPAIPYGSHTYTFSNGVLSGDLGVWSQIIPVNNGQPCWVIQATALSDEATDTIERSEWSSPNKLVEDGSKGADGVSVYLQDPITIFTQSMDDPSVVSSDNPKTYIIVKKGNTTVPLTQYTVAKPSTIPQDVNCNYTVTNTTSEKSVNIDTLWTEYDADLRKYYPCEEGYAQVIVTYDGVNYPLNFKFLCNNVGKFKTKVEGDVETSIASKKYYEYNPATGQYDKETTMGEFVRSSSKNTSVLTETENDTISAMSEVLQKVDNISLTVYENKEGIDLFTHTDDVVVGTSWTTIPTISNTTDCKTMCVSIPMEIEKKSADSTINFRIYTKNTSGGATIDTIIQSCTFNNGVLTSTGNKSRFDAITSYVRDSKEYVKGVLYFEKTQSSTFKMVDVDARNTGTTVLCTLFKSRKFSVGVSLKDGLIGTGIDIVNGKITNTADQWECQNNSGVKTAWLDADGNFTVTGVYNNLITIIDWDNNIGKELIIGKTVAGTTTYYIDALRCGDYVWIKSLPEYGVAYQIPYYVDNGNYTRGWTRFLTGVEHQMSADEMRQLTGRRISIKIDDNLDDWGTTIDGAFHFQPYPTNDVELQVKNVANGQHYFYVPVSNYVANLYSYRRSTHLVPQIFHIECVSAVFSKNETSPNFHSYGYVWLAESSVPTTNQKEGIDGAWSDE